MPLKRHKRGLCLGNKPRIGVPLRRAAVQRAKPMRPEFSLESLTLDSLLDACQAHRNRAVAASLALATVVAVLDYATGDRFPLMVCYLPCVIVICWVSPLPIAVSFALACCTGWLVDDLLQLGDEALTTAEVWTAVTHLMFFLVIIGMLVRLRAAQEREKHFARVDGLTGLMNSRAFRETAEHEVERARRSGLPLAVAYIDCDNFKEVNDTYGHREGDRLLKAIGQSMQEHVRLTDTPARMGGDEFAILLPAATRQEAEAVMQRVRERLSDVMKQHEWPVTFSIGVVVYESVPDTVDELIHGSDLLMYEVKRQQKDAVAYKLCV